jgi:hypothetical protein
MKKAVAEVPKWFDASGRTVKASPGERIAVKNSILKGGSCISGHGDSVIRRVNHEQNMHKKFVPLVSKIDAADGFFPRTPKAASLSRLVHHQAAIFFGCQGFFPPSVIPSSQQAIVNRM